MRNLLILLLLTSISFSDTISGKVIDLSGNPISNVNIYSGNTGTNSDVNGDFQIDVNNETLLTFSHISFESIQMKSNSNMVVILKISKVFCAISIEPKPSVNIRFIVLSVPVIATPKGLPMIFETLW